MKIFFAFACIASAHAMDTRQPTVQQPKAMAPRDVITDTMQRGLGTIFGQFSVFVELLEAADTHEERRKLEKLRARIADDCVRSIARAVETARTLKNAHPGSSEQRSCQQALKGDRAIIRVCCLTALLSDLAGKLIAHDEQCGDTTAQKMGTHDESAKSSPTPLEPDSHPSPFEPTNRYAERETPVEIADPLPSSIESSPGRQ